MARPMRLFSCGHFGSMKHIIEEEKRPWLADRRNHLPKALVTVPDAFDVTPDRYFFHPVAEACSRAECQQNHGGNIEPESHSQVPSPIDADVRGRVTGLSTCASRMWRDIATLGQSLLEVDERILRAFSTMPAEQRPGNLAGLVFDDQGNFSYPRFEFKGFEKVTELVEQCETAVEANDTSFDYDRALKAAQRVIIRLNKSIQMDRNLLHAMRESRKQCVSMKMGLMGKDFPERQRTREPIIDPDVQFVREGVVEDFFDPDHINCRALDLISFRSGSRRLIDEYRERDLRRTEDDVRDMRTVSSWSSQSEDSSATLVGNNNAKRRRAHHGDGNKRRKTNNGGFRRPFDDPKGRHTNDESYPMSISSGYSVSSGYLVDDVQDPETVPGLTKGDVDAYINNTDGEQPRRGDDPHANWNFPSFIDNLNITPPVDAAEYYSQHSDSTTAGMPYPFTFRFLEETCHKQPEAYYNPATGNVDYGFGLPPEVEEELERARHAGLAADLPQLASMDNDNLGYAWYGLHENGQQILGCPYRGLQDSRQRGLGGAALPRDIQDIDMTNGIPPPPPPPPQPRYFDNHGFPPLPPQDVEMGLDNVRPSDNPPQLGMPDVGQPFHVPTYADEEAEANAELELNIWHWMTAARAEHADPNAVDGVRWHEDKAYGKRIPREGYGGMLGPVSANADWFLGLQ